MGLITYNNNIVFQFVDAVNAKGQFEKGQTESGILLQASFDDSAKDPRWVTVTAVGEKCTVQVGQQVLLPNLRWTSGFKHNGEMFWKTDESQAVAVRDNPQSFLRPLTSYVIFSHRKPERVGFAGKLMIVGGHAESASGRVLLLGPDASPELKGATFWYNDTNFTDNFRHGQFDMAFIKDENILAYEPVGE